MIVIPTYNGYKYLHIILKSLHQFGIKPKDICVVDNKSTDLKHLKYLDTLEQDNYNLLFNPKSTYELGAFKYAYNNIKSDLPYWVLLQDSIKIKSNIFEDVENKLTDNNVYSILTFISGIYDNQNDRTFLTINYGTAMYSKGIFGSMMILKSSVIDKVINDWVIPRNKIESMATERGLSVIFDKHNIEIKGLGVYDPNLIDAGYSHFEKSFGGRK